MSKLAALLATMGVMLAACVDAGPAPPAGRASPDPADQSPNTDPARLSSHDV